MATHRHLQHTSVLPGHILGGVAKIVADFGRGLSRGLAGLGDQRVGVAPARSDIATRVPPRPSDLFVQAIREDSNLEMDWLWLFSQVSSTSERRYCLDRALAINPDSEMARAEYTRLLMARP